MSYVGMIINFGSSPIQIETLNEASVLFIDVNGLLTMIIDILFSLNTRLRINVG